MLFNISVWGITGNFAGAGEPSRIEWNKKFVDNKPKKKKKKVKKKSTTKKLSTTKRKSIKKKKKKKK